MAEKPEIKMEILRAEQIKPDIRQQNGLPESGLIIKRSTRTSPSEDHYELIQTPFLERLNKNITKVRPSFLSKLGSLM